MNSLTRPQLERLIQILIGIAAWSAVLAIVSFAIACGVAIQGRIDVGSEAGRPHTETPCPGTVE